MSRATEDMKLLCVVTYTRREIEEGGRKSDVFLKASALLNTSLSYSRRCLVSREVIHMVGYAVVFPRNRPSKN